MTCRFLDIYVLNKPAAAVFGVEIIRLWYMNLLVMYLNLWYLIFELPWAASFETFVPVDQIVWCKSDDNNNVWHDSEHSASIEGSEFLEQLSDYQFIRKYSSPWWELDIVDSANTFKFFCASRQTFKGVMLT
jgi:hypothetical protein